MELRGKIIVAAAIVLALLAGYRVGVWRQKEASRGPVVEGKYMRPYFAELKIPSQADTHIGHFYYDLVKQSFVGNLLDYTHPENKKGWQFRLHSSRSLVRHPMNRSSNQTFTGVIDGYFGQDRRSLVSKPDAVFYFSYDRLTKVAISDGITLVLENGHIRQLITTEAHYSGVAEIFLFNPQGRIVYDGDYRNQKEFKLFNSEKIVDGLMQAQWFSSDGRRLADVGQYLNGYLNHINYMGNNNYFYLRTFDQKGNLVDKEHLIKNFGPYKEKIDHQEASMANTDDTQR